MDASQGLILGVQVGGWTIESLRRAARDAADARGGRPFVFACANPHSLVVAGEDEAFRRALNGFEAVVADGSGMPVGAALAGVGVGSRITGHDFFDAVMEDLQGSSGHAFFLGSTESVLQSVRERAACDYPAVRLTMLSPPFGQWSPADLERILGAVATSGADVLWVGMTAPRQEKWVAEHRDRLGVPVVGCIGAVFDYYAGTVRRAPQGFRRLGLEWLYRLAGEPQRLWRRTLISAPKFLAACLRQRVGRMTSGL